MDHDDATVVLWFQNAWIRSMFFKVKGLFQVWCDGFVPQQAAITLSRQNATQCKAPYISSCVTGVNKRWALLLHCQKCISNIKAGQNGIFHVSHFQENSGQDAADDRTASWRKQTFSFRFQPSKLSGNKPRTSKPNCIALVIMFFAPSSHESRAKHFGVAWHRLWALQNLELLQTLQFQLVCKWVKTHHLVSRQIWLLCTERECQLL